MSYRPLKEHPDNEIWRWLTKKINDALDCVYGFATNILGQKNSITKDETDKKIQLVNDLTDTELQALGYGTVYGTQDDGTRGFKKDTGGYVGTKQVDETDIADKKIIEYRASLDKFVFVAKPSGGTSSGTGLGFFSLQYLLWRTVIGGEFSGYIDVQMQIGTSQEFSELVYDLDSKNALTSWKAFTATLGQYIDWQSIGLPATDIMDIVYVGTLTFTSGKKYYCRWRVYEHGTENFSDWFPGGVL